MSISSASLSLLAFKSKADEFVLIFLTMPPSYDSKWVAPGGDSHEEMHILYQLECLEFFEDFHSIFVSASAFWSFISSRPLDRRHTILHFHFAVISSSRPLNHSYRRSGTVNIENKINLTSDSCWVIVTNVGCQFKSILFSLIPFLLKCTHRYKPVHYKTVRVQSILSAILNALQWKVC